ncbi:MAG: fructose-bisphosphate aldolase class I [Alphaproteobacteria bacterium]|nr:fructose-bisphosphate aldolase class I [Alphaproteobacteria bacterium]
MTNTDLDVIARKMVAPGKGILAADESTGTIAKRLASIDVENTEDNRRDYRELLFSTEGAGAYISGAILYDETLRQSAADGTPFTKLMEAHGTLPGIKVDRSVHPLAGASDYPVTEGLDGLRGRCEEYASLGARFTKWRAVIKIINGHTPDIAIVANAHALARYAATAQEAGLVPIVEPEVLMDGDHSVGVCQSVTERTLACVFEQLYLHNVRLEGTVLKPNMVVAGNTCSHQPDVTEVADRTLEALRRHVPSAVPGIAFLSGGQSEEGATAHLNAMNAHGAQPWELTFSYGRALQQSTLQAWKGSSSNVAVAQRTFLHRARMNSLARTGAYAADLERELAA